MHSENAHAPEEGEHREHTFRIELLRKTSKAADPQLAPLTNAAQ